MTHTIFTHDGGGKPLPPWILNGGVAYVPMRSKLPSEILARGSAVIPQEEKKEVEKMGESFKLDSSDC